VALIDDRTVAYVAGIVDLLGLIRVRTVEGTQLPVVQVHGKHMATFDYLGELTGTKAIETKRDYTRAGCAEHCAEKHMHIVSRSGRWSLTGAKATVVLWNIQPYLREKKDAADGALAVGLATKFKQGTVGKMRDLGWEIPRELGLSLVGA
jgi:hypothetical protein